jgi:hypothetical protein
MKNSSIEELIGKHPNDLDIFSLWLKADDTIEDAQNKKQRKLTESPIHRERATEIISNWLLKYHIRESTITYLKKERKRKIYDKYGFKEFLATQNLIPTSENENTQKGNLAEVVLSEYLQKTTGYDLLIFKLRYNSNHLQSMKGDDLLLFNKKNLREKIILGESKFRSTPSRNDVEDILSSLGGSIKLPISIPFISGVLRDLGDENMANELSRLQADLFNKSVPVLNVGFIMGANNTHNAILNHNLNSEYRLNQKTLDELYKIGFPIEKIKDLMGKTFKTETLYLKKIDKLIDNIDYLKPLNYKDLILKNSDKSLNPNLVFITLSMEEPAKFVSNAYVNANELLLDIEKINVHNSNSIQRNIEEKKITLDEIVGKSIREGLSFETISSITGLTVNEIELIVSNYF